MGNTLKGDEDLDVMAEQLVNMGLPAQLVSDYMEKYKNDPEFSERMINKRAYIQDKIDSGEIDIKKVESEVSNRMGGDKISNLQAGGTLEQGKGTMGESGPSEEDWPGSPVVGTGEPMEGSPAWNEVMGSSGAPLHKQFPAGYGWDLKALEEDDSQASATRFLKGDELATPNDPTAENQWKFHVKNILLKNAAPGEIEFNYNDTVAQYYTPQEFTEIQDMVKTHGWDSLYQEETGAMSHIQMSFIDYGAVKPSGWDQMTQLDMQRVLDEHNIWMQNNNYGREY